MWTPLHNAAQGSHSGWVALLLAKGANLHAQFPLVLTACHLAASCGDTETVKLLLDHKSDLKLTTRDKCTVLHSAAEAGEPGYLEVITLLLTSGCKALAKDKYGHIALDLVPNNSSMRARGVFSAYMEASLGEQDATTDMEGGVEESSFPLLPPLRTAREEGQIPQIDLMADHSWEVFKNSLDADAEAYFGALPAVNLIEGSPPDSPTGSEAMNWPPLPSPGFPQNQDGDAADVPQATFSRAATLANATESTPHGIPSGTAAKSGQLRLSDVQAHSAEGADDIEPKYLPWDVPIMNIIECMPPGSPPRSNTPAPIHCGGHEEMYGCTMIYKTILGPGSANSSLQRGSGRGTSTEDYNKPTLLPLESCQCCSRKETFQLLRLRSLEGWWVDRLLCLE